MTEDVPDTELYSLGADIFYIVSNTEFNLALVVNMLYMLFRSGVPLRESITLWIKGIEARYEQRTTN